VSDEKKDEDAIEVRMRPNGEHDTEAVISWSACTGDVVTRDQNIMTMEFDKISVDLPSPANGILEIIRETGDKVNIGEVVARIRGVAAGEAAVAARHVALLAEVTRAPEDEGARLVYADFLLEVAGEGRAVWPWSVEETALRGEYIALTGRPPTPAVEARRRFLEPTVASTAVALLPVPGKAHVERGFVTGIDLAVASDWPLIAAAQPIAILGLYRLDRAEAEALAVLPRLESLRVLSVGPYVTDEALAVLLGWGRLGGLRRLTLRGHTLGPASQEAAATLRLDELCLHGSPMPVALTVSLLELHLAFRDAQALEQFAASIPSSVREVKASISLQRRLTEEEHRAVFGSRYTPAHTERWW
jgi:uncharacterized protein (TIGR02996 family)